MHIKQQLYTALQALRANVVRSSLTILGILIGITSIMTMVSMGSGAESIILGQISGLGAETVVVRPGKEPAGLGDVGQSILSDSLKDRDVDLLMRKDNVPDLVDIVPMVIVIGEASYKGSTYTPSIFGADPEFFGNAFDVYARDGFFFTDEDTRAKASVAVVGQDIVDELFENENPIGQRMSIKDRKFTIVGVFSDGTTPFFDFNKTIMVPPTTAQEYLLGIDYYQEIIITAASPELAERVVADVERTLREAHNISDPEDDDFYVSTQQALVEQVQSIIGALTIFLSSVVAISLVVGGVGIMNIMLVSVTERTREIGLRKALGATNKDIMVQFLLEAVILTGIGGVVGIILGAVLSFGIAQILTNVLGIDWHFVFPYTASLLGVGMSVVVGLVFGIYPARKASQKSPTEALRYE